MDIIFHEKQDGRLCAQHCLNAILQGPYFSAIELSELAQSLDDEERAQMAENGIDSEDYREFLEQPSNNLDDTGYFSVQVISKALSCWGLELINYSSSEPLAIEARSEPSRMKAYVCHHQNHWFCIRRFGTEWFNLNSLLSGPKYMSDTYLAELLMELQSTGYTIFLVVGPLPECEADKLLSQTEGVTLRELIKTRSQQTLTSKERIVPITIEDDTTDIALRSSSQTSVIEQDEDLQRAITLSLQSNAPSQRHDREHRNHNYTSSAESNDDDELQRALRMSLECFSTPVTPESIDPAELRRLRLSRFDSSANITQK